MDLFTVIKANTDNLQKPKRSKQKKSNKTAWDFFLFLFLLVMETMNDGWWVDVFFLFFVLYLSIFPYGKHTQCHNFNNKYSLDNFQRVLFWFPWWAFPLFSFFFLFLCVLLFSCRWLFLLVFVCVSCHLDTSRSANLSDSSTAPVDKVLYASLWSFRIWI